MIMKKRKLPFFQLPNIIIDKGNVLTDAELRLYVILYRYINNNEFAFPSYNHLAMLMGKSQRQTIRIMNSLVEKGFVIKKIRTNGRQNISNLYYLTDLSELLSDVY